MANEANKFMNFKNICLRDSIQNYRVEYNQIETFLCNWIKRVQILDYVRPIKLIREKNR